MRKKVFFSTEFTSLSKDNSLFSIGLISESGESFYAECSDYDRTQITDLMQKNIIEESLFLGTSVSTTAVETENISCLCFCGTKVEVKEKLTTWFAQFGKIEIWADCLAYDWDLFCNIFGSVFEIPQNISYIPFDISTMLMLKGIDPEDPDIFREKFAGVVSDEKYNALYNAFICKACYEKLVTL